MSSHSCPGAGWRKVKLPISTIGSFHCRSTCQLYIHLHLALPNESLVPGHNSRDWDEVGFEPPTLQLLDDPLHLLSYCRLTIVLPGVIQLESKRASVGSTSPLSRAFFILSSASLADLHTNMWKTLIKYLKQSQKGKSLPGEFRAHICRGDIKTFLTGVVALITCTLMHCTSQYNYFHLGKDNQIKKLMLQWF